MSLIPNTRLNVETLIRPNILTNRNDKSCVLVVEGYRKQRHIGRDFEHFKRRYMRRKEANGDGNESISSTYSQ